MTNTIDESKDAVKEEMKEEMSKEEVTDEINNKEKDDDEASVEEIDLKKGCSNNNGEIEIQECEAGSDDDESNFDPTADLNEEQLKTLNKLKEFQEDVTKIETEFRKEKMELEKKYREKFAPYYEKRSEQLKEEPIPKFWLNTFRNHRRLFETIEDYDVPILEHLKDVRCAQTNDHGTFELHFEFDIDNPYFGPHILTKVYHMSVEEDYRPSALTKIDSTTIQWKDGQNVTIKEQVKKQKNKKNNQIRQVKEMVPQPSFFQFFQKQDIPPPEAFDDMEPEEAEELEENIQHDYEIGVLLKEKILHDAVGWFTGEAEDSDDESDEETDEEDEDDDDDDDDSDEDSSPRKGGKKFLKSTKPPQAVTGGTGGSIFDKPTGEKKEDCKQQ